MFFGLLPPRGSAVAMLLASRASLKANFSPVLTPVTSPDDG